MDFKDFKARILKLHDECKFSWRAKILSSEHKDLLEYVEKNAPAKLKDLDLPFLSAKIYCILNSLDDFPKCPKCGRPFTKVPFSFKLHLCGDCSRKDEKRISKAKQTISANGGYEEIVKRSCKTKLQKKIEDPNYASAIVEKMKTTKLKRYGDENFVNREKAKQTCLEKYGSENVLSLKSVREKSMKTVKEKWGVDNVSKADEIKERIRLTHLKNHGVPWPMQNPESKKKAQAAKAERYGDPTFTNPDKCKKTKAERYGDPTWNNREKFKKTFSAKTPEETKAIADKIKKTKAERYGDPNYCNSDKIKRTCLNHFGVDSPFKDERVQQLVSETYLRRTGYAHPSKNPSVMQKKSEDYHAKTGFFFPAQNPEVRRKQQQKLFYDGQNFGSSYELAYYVYLKDKNVPFEYQPNVAIPYEHEGKTHYYHPDFKVEGQLIEIKGGQFFKDDGTMQNPYDESLDGVFEAKRQCMLEHGVKILRETDLTEAFSHVKTAYGRNYLEQFRKNRDGQQ